MTAIEHLLALRPDSWESFDLAHSILMNTAADMAAKTLPGHGKPTEPLAAA